jgi:hypothetical protein
MNLPQTFVHCSSWWIKFDKNTYSVRSTLSVNKNIIDCYLLTLSRTSSFNKLKFYDHVKYIFPDKLFYQRIY